MIDCTVIEAKAHHCGQMIRLLRHEHSAALARIGINGHRELRAQFDASSFRRAWMINGKLAALGGVVGPLIAETGLVWLTLSEPARRYPLAIIREARRQLDLIMITKREIATTILSHDEAARRLAIFLGFHVADEGRGRAAFTRFGRRDLARFLDNNADCRIPVKGSYVIAMGYHRNAEAA